MDKYGKDLERIIDEATAAVHLEELRAETLSDREAYFLWEALCEDLRGEAEAEEDCGNDWMEEGGGVMDKYKTNLERILAMLEEGGVMRTKKDVEVEVLKVLHEVYEAGRSEGERAVAAALENAQMMGFEEDCGNDWMEEAYAEGLLLRESRNVEAYEKGFDKGFDKGLRRGFDEGYEKGRESRVYVIDSLTALGVKVLDTQAELEKVRAMAHEQGFYEGYEAGRASATISEPEDTGPVPDIDVRTVDGWIVTLSWMSMKLVYHLYKTCEDILREADKEAPF